MRKPPSRLLRFLAASVVLAGALVWGRTHRAPDLITPAREIFPEARRVELQQGVYHVYGEGDALLGWTGAGTADGYGGPMLLVTGIDTLGTVVGVRVVEQRETPVFWRMVRARDYFRGISGSPFEGVDYDYQNVVAVTGATISANAIVESIRTSVAEVAGVAFDVRLPLPPRPFEFGLLELAILLLFALGVFGHRVRGPSRRRLRWAGQLIGLLVLGFWKNSPITLAKIAAFLAGYFPDPRTALAIYLLFAGFLLTSVFYGRNLYCLYACPFGAAQRVVGAIGGFRLKLPPWAVRFMGTARNLVVFVALFLAFITLRPALASYEPFAALFSLHGTTLQWFLLFIVLTASLLIQTPWCSFFCPMRTVELVVLDTKRWLKPDRREDPS
jgi:NosR/NirI family nitrous oxide reductase transcriptional regulator